MKNVKPILITLGVIALTVLLVALYMTYRLNTAVLHSTPSASPVTAQATSSSTPQTLRAINTPAILIDDMHLTPGQCHYRILDAKAGAVLPDKDCTPGAIDPAVTQANIQDTICVASYTKTVRPPSSVTNKAKAASLKQYSQKYDETIEYDHLVPLTLGGASTTSNLWPQLNEEGATSFANPKDKVAEVYLNRAVCAGLVELAPTQAAVADNWTTALDTLNLELRNGSRSICVKNTQRCTSTSWK